MKRVLILGATSSIAAEVAYIHAQRGDRIHLVGRNEAKLKAIAERCRGASMQVADFANLDANENVIGTAIAALGGVDTVLIAHGDLGDQLASERSFKEAQAIFVANFTSVVSLLIPLANYLESARAGSIGVITSVAAERGRPRNYTYGTAKGALNVYLQGLRTRLYAANVSVTTLKLGPVDTPMTATHKKHPLFAKPESVAKDIVSAIEAKTAEAYVPFYWAAIMQIVKSTPEVLFQKIPFLSGR